MAAKKTGTKALFTELSRALAKGRPGYEKKLAAGAKEPAVAKFEKAIGVELPEVFYDLFRWHDGADPKTEFPRNLVERGDFDGLSVVLSTKQSMDSLERAGTFNQWAPGDWWNLGWVPLFDGHSYNIIVLDTAGSFGGKPGQILKWSKDSPSRDILYPSLDKLLEVLIATNDAGLWIGDDDGWHIDYNRTPEAEKIAKKICPGFPKKAKARSRESASTAPSPKTTATKKRGSGRASKPRTRKE